MADRVLPGPVASSASIREAVCVNTQKIFDSCRDKDCIEDLRVYPTPGSQYFIDTAFSIRPRSAELLYADVNVEAITFNRGYYTVDITYFYKVTGETSPGGHTVTGLCVFDKRVMLCGGTGGVKTFSSKSCGCPGGETMPIAEVDAVDPVALHMKIVDCGSCPSTDVEQRVIPEAITACFDEPPVTSETHRMLLVTLGQFSIVRLERSTQLLIPAYDYCVPEKECQGSTEDDPCTMFARIRFPVEEFFPADCPNCDLEDYRDLI